MNETISFNYSSSAQRLPVYLIGETSPTRVTLENTETSMQLRGSDIGGVIQTSGTNANITCHLEDINSRSNITNFNVNGIINSQRLSVNEGGYLQGQIEVSEASR